MKQVLTRKVTFDFQLLFIWLRSLSCLSFLGCLIFASVYHVQYITNLTPKVNHRHVHDDGRVTYSNRCQDSSIVLGILYCSLWSILSIFLIFGVRPFQGGEDFRFPAYFRISCMLTFLTLVCYSVVNILYLVWGIDCMTTSDSNFLTYVLATCPPVFVLICIAFGVYYLWIEMSPCFMCCKVKTQEFDIV